MKKQLLEDMAELLGVTEDENGFTIDWASALQMVERRERAAKQVEPCPKCGTIQVQLTDWTTDNMKMKCRRCKHKFEKILRPIPVGCEAYCACPACFGPGHEEWYSKGSPTLCTDGKIHYMTRPGYPVVEEN